MDFIFFQAVKAVANILKKPSLNAAAIQAGKNQLKLQILCEADAGASVAESMAAQGFYTGSVKTPAEIAKQIDALSPNDVSQVK